MPHTFTLNLIHALMQTRADKDIFKQATVHKLKDFSILITSSTNRKAATSEKFIVSEESRQHDRSPEHLTRHHFLDDHHLFNGFDII